MTDAHNPKLLSDADAAADLAGLPRPDRGAPKYASEANTEELLLTSKQPDALHLADALEKSMQYPLHGKAADMLRALVSERDALAGRVRELEGESDKLVKALGECRDIFPAPPHGGSAEHEWMQAMGCPEAVPNFIREALASKEQP